MEVFNSDGHINAPPPPGFIHPLLLFPVLLVPSSLSFFFLISISPTFPPSLLPLCQTSKQDLIGR